MVEKLYTLNEVLDILRVSRATLYRHMESGLIKPVKLGRRVLFPETEINRLIKQLKKDR